MALLDVKELSVHFGDEKAPFKAVDRISYQINQGEVLGIVGESGSGKSVSSLAVMGLIDFPGRVSAKGLEFEGKDLLSLPPKEKRELVGADIAMIFQDPMTSLNPAYTVGFQIMEAIKAHQGGSKKERRERTLELLRLVGIPDPESRSFMQAANWLVTIPGLVILSLVLAFNLMGDGLRDALDPKLKQ